MDKQLKEKIFNILNELPSENCCLDYKAKDYKGNMGAFLKDLDSFLNCTEGYGKDKFIIIGVSDKPRKIIGINEMQDDNEFQNVADKIEPRPKIETGTVVYKDQDKDYNIGYIYIPAENTDRVYSFKDDFPKPTKKNNTDLLKELKEQEESKVRVFASTAFIRRGSCNKIITEADRREIYEMDRKSKMDFTATYPAYYDINATIDNDIILKAAIIFGAWDEENENDKQIISKFIGKPYNEWIQKLRVMIKDKNNIFEYKNNEWKVKNRFNNIKQIAPTFFKDELEAFKESAINILSERNPKFDLEADKRSMAIIYKKNTKYSNTLRKSVAEMLPIITANYKEFKTCKYDAEDLPFFVVRKVLENNNWEIWASVGDFLPLFAEATPGVFLDQVDNKLKNNPEMMNKLFSEKEYYVTTHDYCTGLYRALELTAWETRNLNEVCMLLAKIAKFDKESIDHIVRIILPWAPQTKASFEYRIGVVKNILKENTAVGWEVLKNLMPGKVVTSFPTNKPKWNNIIEEIDESNKDIGKDYWKQIEEYVDLAILYSKNNDKKICDLIDIIDDVSKKLFDKIFDKLSSDAIKKLSENKKFVIWNHLEDLIARHKRIHNEKLPIEAISKLELLSASIKPKEVTISAKRYFRNDTWNLVDISKDYETGEKKLHKIQVKLVEAISKQGYEKIIDFSKSVENSYMVGVCMAEVKNNDEVESEILNCLESKNKSLIKFGKGYANRKFTSEGNSWLEKVNVYGWSRIKKLNLLLILPYTKNTFELVEKVLKSNASSYWKEVDMRSVKEIDDLNYAIKKLLNVKRPDMALRIISSKLYEDEKCDYDREIAIKCLKEMVCYQNNANNVTILSSYNISKIISNLQESNVKKKELFDIEWSYLSILDEECRPKTIEETLANDPSVYNDIICLLYKPYSQKDNPQNVDKKVTENASRLLDHWKLVPGLENGTISKKKLNEWYKKMVEICTKSDRLEPALFNFGKVLYYSPEDKSGFWINKNVAEILNQENADTMRKGFKNEAFNSQGFFRYDSEGIDFKNKAKEYNKKADLANKEGFFRLAKAMRSLADTYEYEAENISDHYSDWK